MCVRTRRNERSTYTHTHTQIIATATIIKKKNSDDDNVYIVTVSHVFKLIRLNVEWLSGSVADLTQHANKKAIKNLCANTQHLLSNYCRRRRWRRRRRRRRQRRWPRYGVNEGSFNYTPNTTHWPAIAHYRCICIEPNRATVHNSNYSRCHKSERSSIASTYYLF